MVIWNFIGILVIFGHLVHFVSLRYFFRFGMFSKKNLATLLVRPATSISRLISCRQGCQMVCFQKKNTNFGKIWSAL
jgi:hypothetical protein